MPTYTGEGASSNLLTQLLISFSNTFIDTTRNNVLSAIWGLFSPVKFTHKINYQFSSVQSLSRVWLFASPWGLPVHHQLPEFTQTHVHWVSDAIQPSHPPSSPSPPAPNLSQHQGLFKWVSSSHQVVKVLEFQLQHQSFQWIPRTDLL